MMKHSRHKRIIVAIFVTIGAMAGALYWQVERLRAEREETARRVQREDRRIDTIEDIDAAKAAFGRVLADVGTMVDSARFGRFSFRKADSDTLRVLYQLIMDKPAPRCFGPARLASLNAVGAAMKYLGETTLDGPAETVTDEDRERARVLTEMAPTVAQSITAARHSVEIACQDWLLKNGATPQ
jgi:hypothetical protein